MGGSPTSAGRDTGRKGHQRCLTKDSDLPTLGDPYGPPQADPPTPQQAPSIQDMQHDGIWGVPCPWGHLPQGSPLRTGGTGLSPGLPVGLCGTGGSPPVGQLGLLEKQKRGYCGCGWGLTAAGGVPPCFLVGWGPRLPRAEPGFVPMGCAASLPCCLLPSPH